MRLVKCEKFLRAPAMLNYEKEWDELLESALSFASQLGEQRLINVSHSIDINGTKSVFVWYWHDAAPDEPGKWLTD